MRKADEIVRVKKVTSGRIKLPYYSIILMTYEEYSTEKQYTQYGTSYWLEPYKFWEIQWLWKEITYLFKFRKKEKIDQNTTTAPSPARLLIISFMKILVSIIIELIAAYLIYKFHWN